METKAYHKANLLDMSLLRNVLQEGELAKQVWEHFLGFPVRSIDSIKKEELLAVGFLYLMDIDVSIHLKRFARKIIA